ncbi:MAG: hypothetical protein FWD93_00975 [Coriobacteriia bacterium]|nr:hypothetical protein [Coriobacteriia bacterium]
MNVPTSAREKSFFMRLSDCEYTRLKSVSSQMNMTASGYLRAAIDAQHYYLTHSSTGHKALIVMDDKALDGLHLELSRWGNNYNQAVKAINTIAKILRGSDSSFIRENIHEVLLEFLSELKGVKVELLQVYEGTSKLCKKIEAIPVPIKSSRWKRGGSR